ncbi:hypothetical protein JOD27_003917 [Lentzea nigeriaca]|nr:hypothetical protein [Lentzea nigeriaca]
MIEAVHRITAPAPDGLGISQRTVTVSTVGLVPAIRKLTEEKLQVRLAVSLHTPDDELRNTLVPVNTRWDVAEVLEAARGYADQTGRRVSIEYALIRDINDQPWRADLLGKKLRKHLGQLVHVNLIPLNPKSRIVRTAMIPPPMLSLQSVPAPNRRGIRRSARLSPGPRRCPRRGRFSPRPRAARRPPRSPGPACPARCTPHPAPAPAARTPAPPAWATRPTSTPESATGLSRDNATSETPRGMAGRPREKCSEAV